MRSFNPSFPSTEDLRQKAKRRIPRFAFEYLEGGCNEDVNLHKNTKEIREIELKPVYLQEFESVDITTSLFGHTYNAPFGISPIGLQGLMWPQSAEILAQAAYDHNIPFVLSTVTTASIEKIAAITQGKCWFQLYHPAEETLTNDILKRLEVAGVETLVVLCDVPSFGFRPRDIRNGLAMPPRMTLKNMLQILECPLWAFQTLIKGMPEFATMKPYMPKGLSMKQLGQYMNKTFSGRLNIEKVARLREKWKGNLVLKGVASPEDAEVALTTGFDGIIVSNHGGRQLDAAQSAIQTLPAILSVCNGTVPLMIDSGFRSGPDIARGIAAGADFVFLGRTFMYGVAALGNKGGDHTIALMKAQIQQLMEQVNCKRIEGLRHRLVPGNMVSHENGVGVCYPV